MKKDDFAEGTRVLKSRSEYRVRIRYCEPTYAKQTSSRAKDYRWTFRVVADSVDQAKTLATAEFRNMARLSSVGWARQIMHVDVLD